MQIKPSCAFSHCCHDDSKRQQAKSEGCQTDAREGRSRGTREEQEAAARGTHSLHFALGYSLLPACPSARTTLTSVAEGAVLSIITRAHVLSAGRGLQACGRHSRGWVQGLPSRRSPPQPRLRARKYLSGRRKSPPLSVQKVRTDKSEKGATNAQRTTQPR